MLIYFFYLTFFNLVTYIHIWYGETFAIGNLYVDHQIEVKLFCFQISNISRAKTDHLSVNQKYVIFNASGITAFNPAGQVIFFVKSK